MVSPSAYEPEIPSKSLPNQRNEFHNVTPLFPGERRNTTNPDERKLQNIKLSLKIAISNLKEQDRKKFINVVFCDFLRLSEKEAADIKTCTDNEKISEKLFENLICLDVFLELIEHLRNSYSVSDFRNLNLENCEDFERHRTPKKVDILIITAMREEWKALLSCEKGWSQRKSEKKIQKESISFPYCQRTFRDLDQKPFTVAAAYVGGTGAKYTAIWATHLVLELKPICLAMTGICAGYEKKTKQGDVIVANQIFDTGGEFRRYFKTSGDEQSLVEEIRPNIDVHTSTINWIRAMEDFKDYWEKPKNKPKSRKHQKWWFLRNMYKECKSHPSFKPNQCEGWSKECKDMDAVVENLKEEDLIKFDSALKGYVFTEKGSKELEEKFSISEGYSDPDEIKVYLGSIGTIDKVQKDLDLFSTMEHQRTRDVIAMEMEGSAIAAVSKTYNIPMLLIKAVQDFGDIRKDGQFKEYAAKASAKFLLDFLKETSSVSTLMGR